MAWLRLYDDVLDDPKILMLSDRAHRMLINLWCLAKRNGGTITGDLKPLSLSLRQPQGRVADTLQALLSAGLIDRIEGGYEPHNWKGRQFQSDSSTDRVDRFRQRRRNGKSNGDETLHATAPESETEQIQSREGARGRAPPSRSQPTSGEEMEKILFAKWDREKAAPDDKIRSISSSSEADESGVHPAAASGEG